MAKETLIVDLDAEMANRVREYSREHGADVGDVLNGLISTLPEHGGSNGRKQKQNGSKADLSDSSDDWRSELTPAVRSLLGGAANDGRDAARDDPEDEEWLRNLPPITRRLLGAASSGVSEEDYKDYLWQKYGR